ncbi:MAG TPA: ATP-binding cassette domain-containing protein [Candidatus Omnitrophota bacterium]|nr:ATP-binding cassette domain-containing protein [Candidatus Omnitrophota bacterium]HNQ50453.1 ATP-binding cassette domain-containing protein [Candidatus Omnitrophota bacterium]HQO38647.1 ATP-binding cassette domain-containing protein [Candidatus Omnitrophota bacterium]HQQ05720.1 ATP-binding cassette domain-containing protein [Candidatus Omnitrophota bacterium]
MLSVHNVSVRVGDKMILKGINFSIAQDIPAVLFGPNGSGKSTLLKAIMGFEGYAVTEGDIIFKGARINDLPTEARVKMGLGIMYQHPPQIRGVKLSQIAEFLCRDRERIAGLSVKLSLDSHLGRDINMGFSGGEMKRSELFQILLQDPDLVLLDEPESGVDLENISIMGTVLNEFLKKPGKSALMITHTGYILDYVRSENGCVMIDGSLWCVGNPKEMFESIRKFGYDKCKECSYVQGRDHKAH